MSVRCIQNSGEYRVSGAVDRVPSSERRDTVSSLRRITGIAVLPATVLGAYPEVQGWLHVVDIFFGLGLVALSEEIVFRRCARHLLQSYLDDAMPWFSQHLFCLEPITDGRV